MKKLTKKQRIKQLLATQLKLQNALALALADLNATGEALNKAQQAKENWKHIATYNGGEVKAALQLLAEALGINL